jgi:hypothetical protein
LIRDGVVTNQAELARLGQVTQARVTQIMNLQQLAPDIQEALLYFLIDRGKSSIYERLLPPIASLPDWRKQRKIWSELFRSA